MVASSCFGVWHKTVRATLLAGMMLAIGLPGKTAVAGPATDGGAREITDALGRNLGKVWIDKGVISVKPDGEGYDLTLDIGSAKLGLPGDGMTFSLKPFTLRLTPKGERRFAFELPKSTLELTYRNPALFFSEEGSRRLVNCSGEGLLDLDAFLVSEGNLQCESSTASNSVGVFGGEGKTGLISLKLAGTAVADGNIDGRISYEVSSFVETFGAKIGDALPTSLPKPEMTTKVDGIRHDFSVSGLRKTGLTTAFAFLSDRFLRGPGTATRAEIEALAKGVMPLWSNASLKSHYENLSWGTPRGPIKFAVIDAAMKNEGLVEHTDLDGTLSVSGMQVPGTVLPSWAAILVPEKITLDTRLKDLDLESLVDGAIEVATRGGSPVPGEMHALLLRVFSNNRATLAFDATATASGYDIKGQGMTSMFPSQGGKAIISAAGVDAIDAVLAKAAVSDPMSRRAVLGVAFLKGLAKTGSDGRLIWNVEFERQMSKITVNGQSFGPGTRQ